MKIDIEQFLDKPLDNSIVASTPWPGLREESGMKTITVDISAQVQQIRDRVERAAQAILTHLPDAESVVRDLEGSSNAIDRMVAAYYRKLEAAQTDLPTRIIAGETPGWLNATVYLNGELVKHCIEADSKAGYVVVHVSGQQDEHGEPVTRMLSGNVEIRMSTDDQPPA